MIQRGFTLEIKGVTDEGKFSGAASVYGVVDLGGDVVERGAFSKSLSEGKQLPLLYRHDSAVGLVALKDTPEALLVEGQLSMGLQLAKDTLTLMRDGVVRGLSIGYRVIRHEFQGEVRRLKELKLYEVSLVPFPMNEQALVTSVKSARQADRVSRALNEFRSDILRALER